MARQLGVVVHDLRGPATALQAYARFLDEQARPSLDGACAGWLDAFQANAELTAHLCEALGILDGTSLRSGASVRDILVQAGGRLQKLLARAGLTLKVSGEFPDRRSERRRLGFAAEALLVAAAADSGGGPPATLEWTAREREERIVLNLRLIGDGASPLTDLVERLQAGHPAGLSEMALGAALADLEGRLESPDTASIDLWLPVGTEVSWP